MDTFDTPETPGITGDKTQETLEVPDFDSEEGDNKAPETREPEKKKSDGNIFDMFADDMEENKASEFAKKLDNVDIYDLLADVTSLKDDISGKGSDD